MVIRRSVARLWSAPDATALLALLGPIARDLAREFAVVEAVVVAIGDRARAAVRCEALIEEVEALGIEIVDCRGSYHLPTVDPEPGYLCWGLGEREVTRWHRCDEACGPGDALRRREGG